MKPTARHIELATTSAGPLWVLVTVLRTEAGFSFSVDGVGRVGVECPAWLSIVEYAQVHDEIERSLILARIPVGAQRGLSVIVNRPGVREAA